jgi:hypothetical protein|tara:strand:- start:16908 stop:17198 length:291 start_codon:yes stop_codon:yes gene_type:complete
MKQIINCTTGEVTIEEFTDEEIAAAAKAVEDADKDFTSIRASRNQRLAASDWTQGADSPLTDAKKAKWVTYRQELRDYPAQASKVSELPAWPTEPS